MNASKPDCLDPFLLVRSTPRRRVILDHASTEPLRKAKKAQGESNHDRAVVAAVAFSIAIALAVSWALRPPPTAPDPWLDRPAPDFTLSTDLGPLVTLSEMRGSVVVIHFIILVCCSYSAIEVTYMKEVEPTVADQGVAFISIAMNSEFNYYTPEKYRELMGFDWTLAMDSDGGVQRLYEAEETSTFLIDREGIIHYWDADTTSREVLLRAIQGAM